MDLHMKGLEALPGFVLQEMAPGGALYLGAYWVIEVTYAIPPDHATQVTIEGEVVGFDRDIWTVSVHPTKDGERTQRRPVLVPLDWIEKVVVA